MDSNKMAMSEYMRYEEEGIGTRLLKKAQSNPFLVLGIVGGLATLGVGAYRFKNRDKSFPMSLYFIQLRVAAQSAVIGSLTIGMTYGMLREYVFNDKEKPKTQQDIK